MLNELNMSLEVTEQILGRFQDELKQVFTEQPELMRGGAGGGIICGWI